MAPQQEDEADGDLEELQVGAPADMNGVLAWLLMIAMAPAMAVLACVTLAALYLTLPPALSPLLVLTLPVPARRATLPRMPGSCMPRARVATHSPSSTRSSS